MICDKAQDSTKAVIKFCQAWAYSSRCFGNYYLFILQTEVYLSPFMYRKGISYFFRYSDCNTASKVEGFAFEQVNKPIVLFFIDPLVFALRTDLNSNPYTFFNLLTFFFHFFFALWVFCHCYSSIVN